MNLLGFFIYFCNIPFDNWYENLFVTLLYYYYVVVPCFYNIFYNTYGVSVFIYDLAIEEFEKVIFAVFGFWEERLINI